MGNKRAKGGKSPTVTTKNADFYGQRSEIPKTDSERIQQAICNSVSVNYTNAMDMRKSTFTMGNGSPDANNTTDLQICSYCLRSKFPFVEITLSHADHGKKVLSMAPGLERLNILPFKVAAYDKKQQKMEVFYPSRSSRFHVYLWHQGCLVFITQANWLENDISFLPMGKKMVEQVEISPMRKNLITLFKK
ncbi:ATP sulfurylase 1, chloroplastic-like protein, partial [Tanacetum coccineum]